MRSGLVLYRLVFIKNAPVCAGAFFLREMARRTEKSPALRRAGGAARRQDQGMPIFLFGIFIVRGRKGSGNGGFSAADTRGCCLSGDGNVHRG